MPPNAARCSRIRPRWILTAALAVTLGSPACSMPNFHGPQIQTPPPAFFKQPASYQNRRMFNDLEIAYHDAWVETSWGFFSGIYINGYPALLGRADVEAAREAADNAELRPVTFGPVEEFTIDGRTSWGWSEILQTEERGIEYVAFRVAIPYDTISYAIEFHGGEPGLKGRPDSLRTIVASFAIGETTWNLPLIAVMAGAMLLLVSTMRARSRARAQRLQSITLKKFPKKEEKPEEKPGGTAKMQRIDKPPSPT